MNLCWPPAQTSKDKLDVSELAGWRQLSPYLKVHAFLAPVGEPFPLRGQGCRR